MTTTVFKAQAIGAQVIPDLELTATEPMPDLHRGWTPAELQAHAERFEHQAAQVVSALYASLPGGTLDQILRLMLTRKASQFIVRF